MKEKGYDCTGVTFTMFDKTNPIFGYSEEDAERDIKDAEAVCKKVGIPLEVIDASKEFKEYVIDDFIDTYEKGGTPNPCVCCNKNIKFKLLKEISDKYGYDAAATGHYAKTGYDEKTGRYCIKKAKDLSKDQSYVLWPLSQEQLKNIVFPLADLTKDQVRQIAETEGFANAHKSDSQDICFVHDCDYADFIIRTTGKTYPTGKFVDLDGNILGTHKGIINYTIGQRRGLDIPYGERIYVKEKNPINNTVVLANDTSLYKSEIYIENFNFVSVDASDFPKRCKVKIRYKHPEKDSIVQIIDKTTVKITFDEPQRAPASGQSAVLYDGDTLLGGGTIRSEMRN